jgi:hypothetical protein
MAMKKAASLHHLQGTYVPSRHQSETVATGDPPVKPANLPPDVSAAWSYLRRAAAAHGRPLLRADEPTLEAASYLLAQIRAAPAEATGAMWGNYRGFLRELKLTANTREPAPEPHDTSWD